jgi:hypothetical protein
MPEGALPYHKVTTVHHVTGYDLTDEIALHQARLLVWRNVERTPEFENLSLPVAAFDPGGHLWHIRLTGKLPSFTAACWLEANGIGTGQALPLVEERAVFFGLRRRVELKLYSLPGAPSDPLIPAG